MSKILVLIVSAVIGAAAWLGLSHSLRDAPSVGAGSGPGVSQARCVRQFDELDVAEETASKICGCMLTEFDNRGIKVLDAFAGDFDEMKQITRNCAQAYGVALKS